MMATNNKIYLAVIGEPMISSILLVYLDTNGFSFL